MPNYFQTTKFTMPIVAGFNLYWADDIAVADFSNDGKVDVLISYHALDNVTLPLRLLGGDGAGGFSDITSQVFGATKPVAVSANKLITADFNADGKPDLFVLDTGHDFSPYPGYPDSLYLAGTGTLMRTTLPSLSDFGHSASVGDIDGDGDPDIYVGNIHGQADIGPYFLINDGRANFTADTTRLPTAIARMQGEVYTASLLADFNGDGKPDLFLGAIGLDAAKPGVWWNDGTGRFTTRTATPELNLPGVETYTSASAVDLNGDGRLDILAGLGLESYSKGGLQILINLGGGQFADETAARIAVTPQVTAGTGGFFRPLLYDVNRDGYLDIVLNGFSTTPILLNDGSGRFLAMPAGLLDPPTPNAGAITYYPYPDSAPRPPPAFWVDHFAVGDFNGDGRTDFISARGTTYQTSEDYVVFLGVDNGSAHTGTASSDGLMGDNDAETLNGLAGDDVIFAGGGGDTLLGGDGADRLVGGAGDDQIDGGLGADIAYYSGARSAYVITATANGWRVSDGRGTDGVDLVKDVETLQFSQSALSLPGHLVGLTVDSLLRENPLAEVRASQTLEWSAKIASGALTMSGVVDAVVRAAGASTSVATLAYQFFTGKIPSLAGVDYLVSPTGPNPNNLNSAYYQTFNLENRYINFAVNLGKIGEGAAKFSADYGALSLFEATRKAYGAIFGGTPNDAKVHALIDSRVDYFAYYGGDGANGVGTKAAMVGWLLAEAQKADLGVMVRSNDAWLTDLADGMAPFAIDLLDPAKGYYKADFIFGGG